MKKMLLATALALLITGCAQQTFTVQNKPAAVAPRNHHPSFLRFWNWAEENCRCGEFVALKMLLKRNPANIRKWIARFYYFRHLCSAGSAYVLTIITPELPIDMSGLYLYTNSLIYFWVPSSCFCIVISLSLRVK